MAYNWDKVFEIRDDRNGGWYWVQKEILSSDKLLPSDKLVYSGLAYYANNKTQQAYPTVRTIANLLKIAKSTVQLSIKKLVAYRLIGIEKVKTKHGRSNTYVLLKVSISGIVVPIAGTSHEVVPDSGGLVPNYDEVVPIDRSYPRTNNNNEQELNNNSILSLEESQKRIQLIRDQLLDR